jgi:hypothetical protein
MIAYPPQGNYPGILKSPNNKHAELPSCYEFLCAFFMRRIYSNTKTVYMFIKSTIALFLKT